jgi:hypothetical protein
MLEFLNMERVIMNGILNFVEDERANKKSNKNPK